MDGFGLLRGVTPGMSLSGVPGGNVWPWAPTNLPSNSRSGFALPPKSRPSSAACEASNTSRPIFTKRGTSASPPLARSTTFSRGFSEVRSVAGRAVEVLAGLNVLPVRLMEVMDESWEPEN